MDLKNPKTEVKCSVKDTVPLFTYSVNRKCPTGPETHVRLHVHQTHFVSGHHGLNGIQAGPIEIFLIFTVFQEPKTPPTVSRPLVSELV